MSQLKNFLSALFLIFLASCGNDKDENPQEPMRIQVYLIDNPGDFEEVNIHITGAEVSYEGSDDNWLSLEVNAGIYDLLELTNGTNVMLVNDELPQGRINQIRLLLGAENTVVLDDIVYPLTIPSGSQSGLKIKINENFQEGVDYHITLDFDASKSIVQTGGSRIFLLKPVIRAVNNAETGVIKGVVYPAIRTSITAVRNADNISTFTDDEGAFLLQSLKPGLYEVNFSPPSEYQGRILEDVVVEMGEVTVLDTVFLD